MTSSKLQVGTALLLVGLVVSLAGSYTDNALGGSGVVVALQVLLWVVGGVLMLAGAASTVALRAGQRSSKQRPRPLRPTVR